MDIQQLDIFTWVLLPIFIFVARIMDVTLGTVRIISLSRGRRILAPLLGFFEVFIWIVAISQIVRNLNNIACYFAYASGFAAGNFIGLLIEEKLAIGMLAVRIFIIKDSDLLIDRLHEAGFGATSLNAWGATGEVKIIFTIIRRKAFHEVIHIIHNINPKIFYSVEEVRSTSEGIFPHIKSPTRKRLQLTGWRTRK
jgi:uncharacterized protein YebE (UPF0316 family)